MPFAPQTQPVTRLYCIVSHHLFTASSCMLVLPVTEATMHEFGGSRGWHVTGTFWVPGVFQTASRAALSEDARSYINVSLLATGPLSCVETFGSTVSLGGKPLNRSNRLVSPQDDRPCPRSSRSISILLSSQPLSPHACQSQTDRDRQRSLSPSL
jgi:hypothetical protein